MDSFTSLLSASGFNWYGFLIGMAMVLSIVICYFIAKKRGYYKDVVFDIAIVCIPTAIVFTRLFYVLFDFIGTGNTWTFKDIIGLGSGGLRGLSIIGGIIGACIGGIIVHFWKRNKPDKNKITFMQAADLTFAMILLAQAIGRWGNFANQEAYGPQVGWHFFPLTVAIDVPGGVEYHLATFFYESMWNLAGSAVLFWLYLGRRKSFDGFIFCGYMIIYGIGRTIIEPLRQDPLMAGDVRISMVFSILFIVTGISFLIAYIYRARQKGKKLFIFVDGAKLDETYFGYKESILSHPNIYPKKGEIAETEESDEFSAPPEGDFYDEGEDYDAKAEKIIEETAEIIAKKKTPGLDETTAEIRTDEDSGAESDEGADKESDDFYN